MLKNVIVVTSMMTIHFVQMYVKLPIVETVYNRHKDIFLEQIKLKFLIMKSVMMEMLKQVMDVIVV
jgi:hypothetical protein